jgi:hypothetical protein
VHRPRGRWQKNHRSNAMLSSKAKQMAYTSDYIPAYGIRFDKAFERLFDADPRAAELRANVDRLIEAELSGGPEYDDAMDKWDTFRREVDLIFRAELRRGALNAYQRDPYIGEELPVSTKNWKDAAILPGEDLGFPPIYFLKSEFEAWIGRIGPDDRHIG